MAHETFITINLDESSAMSSQIWIDRLNNAYVFNISEIFYDILEVILFVLATIPSHFFRWPTMSFNIAKWSKNEMAWSLIGITVQSGVKFLKRKENSSRSKNSDESLQVEGNGLITKFY